MTRSSSCRGLGRNSRRGLPYRSKPLVVGGSPSTSPQDRWATEPAPAKLVVENEEQTLRWAKAMCPAAVVTVLTISKTVLNDHFTATGELADGVRHEAKTERFYVK